MYLASSHIVSVAVMDNSDNRGEFGVSIGCTVAVMNSNDQIVYLASVQVVPIAVMDSIDNRDVFGVCTC